jgi:hypothetical protein
VPIPRFEARFYLQNSGFQQYPDGAQRALVAGPPMRQRMSDNAVLTIVSAFYAIVVFALKFRRA